MTSQPAYRHPTFFERPANRLRLVAELQTVGARVTVIKPGKRRRGGFALQALLSPSGLQRRRVTIEFGPNTPNCPVVYVAGPDSPHRYADGSLCMWYPGDPPERRWTWHDGAAALAGHICAHLILEEWW